MKIPVDVSRDGFQLVRVWPDRSADVVPIHLLIYDTEAPVYDALPEVCTPTMDSFLDPIGLRHVGLQLPDGRVIDPSGAEYETLWRFLAMCRGLLPVVPKVALGSAQRVTQ